MGLAQIQSAFAELSTRKDARDLAGRDPVAFAARHGLSEEEAAELIGTLARETEAFAASLASKRFHEAVKAMPRVEQVLGESMRPRFAQYAELVPLGRERNPALDALAFLNWMLGTDGDGISRRERSIIRYEKAWIGMKESRRWLLIRRLPDPDREETRPRWMIWWRWGGRVLRWPRERRRAVLSL